MAAPFPSSSTSVNRAPEPPLVHMATSAPVDLAGAAVASQLLHAPDDPLQHLHRRAAVAEGHQCRRRW